jgi:hypothetical protein
MRASSRRVRGAGVDEVERVDRRASGEGRDVAHGTERVEHVHGLTQGTPLPRGDGEVLSLRIRHHHAAGIREQVRDHAAHALAAPCGRDGEQMAVARVTQQRSLDDPADGAGVVPRCS